MRPFRRILLSAVVGGLTAVSARADDHPDLLDGKTPEAKAALKEKFKELKLRKTRFWYLDFTYETPQPILVQDTIEGLKNYWYVLYKVTNNTGKLRKPIALDFVIRDDEEKRYHDSPKPFVKESIEWKIGRKLLDSVEMNTQIEDGQTKEGVAIFGQIDLKMDRMSLFVSGLTDEMQTKIENGRTYIWRRVKKIHYERPGDEFQRNYDPVRPQDRDAKGYWQPVEEWVMEPAGWVK